MDLTPTPSSSSPLPSPAPIPGTTSAPPPLPHGPTFPNRPTLRRDLGLWMAIAVVIGNTIGSGIFVKPGRIAADAGSFPLIIAIWLIGAALCILGGFCLAELSSMHPQAGGLYVYLKQAYGRWVAFLFGWQEFLFARPASTGALAVVCVASIAHCGRWNIDIFTSVLAAIAIVSCLTVVNIVGVLWGGWMQAATTIVKCGMVLAIALSPWLFELFGVDVAQFAHYSQQVIPQREGFAAQAAAVLLAVMWAFNGWEGVVPVAEEVRDPGRNIPRALIGGIGLLGLLYISAVAAYHAVIPIDVMAQPENREHVAEMVVAKLFGPIGGQLMSLGIVISTLGTINSNLLTSPRVTYAMGRDGMLSDRFGQLHARFRTPVLAIVAQAIMASVLIVVSALSIRFSETFRDYSIFDLLTNCIVFAASIFYALAVAAVLVLRRTQPDHPRPFRTPGYPWVPIVYLVAYAWFIGSIFLGNPQEAIIGCVLILLGLPLYWFQSRRTAN